jgi:predicted DNA-binding protein
MGMAPKKAKRDRLTEFPTTIRLPADLRERVEALIPKIGSKSTVLRLAVAEGVRALERRYR